MGNCCNLCKGEAKFLRYPITCKCNAFGEGICTSCEDKLFLPSYKQVEEVLYKKTKNGKYVKYRKTVFIKTKAKPKCSECGKAYEKDAWQYDDSEEETHEVSVSENKSEIDSKDKKFKCKLNIDSSSNEEKQDLKSDEFNLRKLKEEIDLIENDQIDYNNNTKDSSNDQENDSESEREQDLICDKFKHDIKIFKSDEKKRRLDSLYNKNELKKRKVSFE